MRQIALKIEISIAQSRPKERIIRDSTCTQKKMSNQRASDCMEKPNTSMKFNSLPKPVFRFKLRHRLVMLGLLLLWVIWELQPYSRLVVPEGHIEMTPTVQPGQTLYLYSHKNFSSYQTGDVVWYSSPKTAAPRLGRIIAKTDDVVAVQQGQVLCNSQAVKPPLQGLPEQLNKVFPALSQGEIMIVHHQQTAPVEDSLTLGPLSEAQTAIWGKLFFFMAN